MFIKAERRKAKLRLALCGPSGSGKTFSALLLAKGLGGKVAVIDTERRSAELYANDARIGLDYCVAPFEPPYTPEKYIAAIKEAESAGFNVLIIDSLTHGWSGEGGLLDMQDAATKASHSKNSYMAWRTVTPAHNRLVDSILNSGMHVICTMRTKTAYDLVDTGNGKKKPVKIGLAPIQRDGMEFEFTIVLDLSVEEHLSSCSKDRTGMFDNKHEVISEETGQRLLVWLNAGDDGSDTLKEYTRLIQESVNEATTKENFGKGWKILKNNYNDVVLSGKLKQAYDDKMGSYV